MGPSHFFYLLCFLSWSVFAGSIVNFPMTSLNLPQGWRVVRESQIFNGLSEVVHLKSNEHFFLRHQVYTSRLKSGDDKFANGPTCQQNAYSKFNLVAKYNHVQKICSLTDRNTGKEMQALRIWELKTESGSTQYLTVIVVSDQGLISDAAIELKEAMSEMKLER